MSAALVFLILIALTNYIMIFFSCHGLHIYGAWLNKYHKLDLWLHRVLVRKEIYSLAGQMKWADCLHLPSAGSEWYRHIRDMDNHCFVGQSEHRADQRRKNEAGRRRHCFVLYFDCGAVFVVSAMQRIEIQHLCCYFVDLRCWHSCRFILENSVLDKHVRYILSIYPAVIWALTGVFTNNYETADPSRNNIFNGEKQINNKQLPFSQAASFVLVKEANMHRFGFLSFTVALLAVGCALFVGRIVLVIWKNIKSPLYADISPELMSPMEIAEKQKRIFK